VGHQGTQSIKSDKIIFKSINLLNTENQLVTNFIFCFIFDQFISNHIKDGEFEQKRRGISCIYQTDVLSLHKFNKSFLSWLQFT
jgi:hypothetical protein